jgi:3-oxoacyl-[acyl-carrier-protein] synthase II
LAHAGLDPTDVGYVNLHGTGTALNDPVETLVMKKIFGDRAAAIPMSSLKSQVGHPQGAAGAAGLVATLLAMKHAFVPPTINLENPDPACDLDYVPGVGRPWSFDTALVNCISFGSKNSALVVTRP